METIFRSGLELNIKLSDNKEELIIKKHCLNFGIVWKTTVKNVCLDQNSEGNKRLNCLELYNLLIQADKPDSKNIWHLKNTDYAIKYPTPFDSLTAPVLNVWTNINDPFESLYNIVLRQGKKK